MLSKIINACQKFSTCVEHRFDPSDDEKEFLIYFNLELAKCIIQDMDENNARQIAKVILDITDK